MPTKKANSDFDYQNNLDIIPVQAIIDKYGETHTVILCGDLNGTPSRKETMDMTRNFLAVIKWSIKLILALNQHFFIMMANHHLKLIIYF